MGTALQDRLPLVTPEPPRRRRTAARLGGAALVAALVLAGADRALDALPSWHNPLAERVVDTQRPALLVAISDLSDYHAAKGTFQVVVDLEKDTPYVPAFVKGERTTYLAQGSVDGVVDLRALGADAVHVDGQAVKIRLPQPQLRAATVDLGTSRVVGQDRGVVDRIGGALGERPTAEHDVAALAQDRLSQAAAGSDLLDRTRQSTREMLTGLARSFGYTDVTVRFDGADQA